MPSIEPGACDITTTQPAETVRAAHSPSESEEYFFLASLMRQILLGDSEGISVIWEGSEFARVYFPETPLRLHRSELALLQAVCADSADRP